MTLQQRLQVVAERVDAQAPSFREVSAVHQWLTVLQVSLPRCRHELSVQYRKTVVARLTRSIALIAEHLARPDPPCADLERFCRACLRRLNFGPRCWRGRELAFLEDEYDRALAAIEKRLNLTPITCGPSIQP